MRDEDNGLTRERDRRVQGGILIALVVVAVVGAFLRVVGFPGSYYSSGPDHHPRSVLEVEVPRPDWPRFVEATDRFAESRGLFMLTTPAGLPVTESTLTVWLFYDGDHGRRMIVDVAKGGQFVVTFRNDAEQTLERAFRTDVIGAGGFRLLP